MNGKNRITLESEAEKDSNDPRLLGSQPSRRRPAILTGWRRLGWGFSSANQNDDKPQKITGNLWNP
jgi:hypothetical protein